MTIEYRNGKLSLCPIQPEDTAELCNILLDDTVKQTYIVPDLTKDAAQKMAEHIAGLSNTEDRYVRGIYRNDTLIGLINDVETIDATIELGWVIAPAHQNKGYATQAVCLAIKELFARGYREVLAGAFPQNAASMRVMEKAGMERIEKTEQIEYRGQTYNCIFYARRNYDQS